MYKETIVPLMGTAFIFINEIKIILLQMKEKTFLGFPIHVPPFIKALKNFKITLKKAESRQQKITKQKIPQNQEIIHKNKHS